MRRSRESSAEGMRTSVARTRSMAAGRHTHLAVAVGLELVGVERDSIVLLGSSRSILVAMCSSAFSNSPLRAVSTGVSGP